MVSEAIRRVEDKKRYFKTPLSHSARKELNAGIF